ncbi:hypothetical protein [Streptomyces sp. NBC_01803]|uniref:hypothetical protein n=1 Tax=Streptomyces sp. NBC_01803 TaxID=2975946 RepID=UPI002DDB7659|nr:hypothetical protein [Streptomyces sp. NBC_01803]WSA47276.1 hypothetical protein OIE51_25715 [Streptomyces sp. NBC_01803]
MRPGEQRPGGEPATPWSNPYQQPGYTQPNPYQTQPGAQVPPPPPTPQPQPPSGQWEQLSGPWQAPSGQGEEPTPPPLPPPPAGGGGGSRRSVTAVAVVVATAVLAAGVITGVVILGGDDEGAPEAAPGDPTPEPTDDETRREDLPPDDPRRGVTQVPDPVVAPDWQVRTIENRHNAFDVPPDWELGSESELVGYENEGAADDDGFADPLVTMSAPATYMDGWCAEAEYGVSWRAVAGTKGGQGATGTAEAARNEAGSWALAAYDQEERGTLRVSESEPFTSEHGIEGHTATATITDVPDDPEDQCGTSDGKVVTVSYIDLNNDLATWVLVMDTGFEGELDDETIEAMMNSLRPFPAEDAG